MNQSLLQSHPEFLRPHDFNECIDNRGFTNTWTAGNYQDLVVNMLLSVPPRYSIAMTVGFLKGKSAIRVARDFMGRCRGYKGYHFWARGYFVSTVGIDERTMREYIRNQEKNDQKLDQQRLF